MELKIKTVFVFASLVLATSLVGCGSQYLGPQGFEGAANLCQSELERRTGSPIDSRVDEIHVWVTREGYWVLFVHGSPGTFRVRSSDYSSVYECGIIVAKRERVAYLSRAFDDPIVGNSDVLAKHWKEPKRTIEALFVLDQSRFVYCCQKVFDPKALERTEKRGRTGPTPI